MGQWLNYTYQKIRKAVHGHIMLTFLYCCNFDNAMVDTVNESPFSGHFPLPGYKNIKHFEEQLCPPLTKDMAAP